MRKAGREYPTRNGQGYPTVTYYNETALNKKIRKIITQITDHIVRE